jgi:hypothetical protein
MMLYSKRSSIDDPDQNHHDGNHQQNMDEATYCIRGNQSQQPQDDENDSDGE